LIQVVDASAVVAAFIDDGPTGRWCEARLVEGDLVGPALLPFEVANVVRRQELRGVLPSSDAANALHDLVSLQVDLVPFEVIAERVWELRSNASVYDASYVAVAERFGGRLVTIDRRIAATPGLSCDVLIAPRTR
jgi:predicted nucleic acid-binding protein